MQQEKTATKKFENFDFTFKGSLNGYKNGESPVEKAVERILSERGISRWEVSETSIEISGGDLEVTVRYRENVEAPEKEKKLVAAYFYEDERGWGRLFRYDAGLKRVVGSMFDAQEFEQDFKTDGNTIRLETDGDVEDYIMAQKTDWKGEFGKAISDMVEGHGYPFNECLLEEFLKNRDIIHLLIDETAESISDTSPREYILEQWEALVWVHCD